MYLDNQHFLAILFDLFLCLILFSVLIFYFAYCIFVLFFGGANMEFILFYLNLLYLDNQQFLAVLVDLFLCPIFSYVLILFEGSVCFKIFWNSFYKKHDFLALLLLIFEDRFSFLKFVESISVLKKCTASAGLFFFCLIFLNYKHIIYFILS